MTARFVFVLLAASVLSGCAAQDAEPTTTAAAPTTTELAPHPCESQFADKLNPYGWEDCLAEHGPEAMTDPVREYGDFRAIASKMAALHDRAALPILQYGNEKVAKKCGRDSVGCARENMAGQIEIVIADGAPAYVVTHETMHWLFASVGDYEEGHGIAFRCALLTDYHAFGWVTDIEFEQMRAACV